LTPSGALVINVGHPEGSSTLERALSKTLRADFGSVWRDSVTPTNTLLIAGRDVSPGRLAAASKALPAALVSLAQATAGRLAPALSGGELLTDDRAPVEWMIDRSIIQYASHAH